jgi:alanyl-tRNA synthetase
VNGAVVAMRDGLVADQMRELVQAVRRRPNVKAVVMGGSPDGEKVVLASATDGSFDAGALVKQAAAIVGGRGGGSTQLATGGGSDTTRIDEALRAASVALGVADSDGAGGGTL